MNVLQNKYLSISINNLGAEIYSIKNTHSGEEYLWEGNPTVWGRHSPVLFPIVGKLKDNSYASYGKKYTLPQHGFARDMHFETKKISDAKIVFSLVSNEETLQKYPYLFKLEISYTLTEKKITVSYHVSNLQDSTMYFSIGAHPGFTCPLYKNESIEDYYLEFEKKETLDLITLENGLISDKTTPYLNQESKIPLSYSLFNNDALIFSDYKSEYISLKHKTKGEVFKFHFKGYPYLGIWSKPGPFVCIEPWYGIADQTNHDGNLATKKGIQSLEAGKDFSCDWAVEFN